MQTSADSRFIVITTLAPANPPVAAPKRATATRLLRALTHRWDMIAVVSLMVSSAAYGIYALAHLPHF